MRYTQCIRLPSAVPSLDAICHRNAGTAHEPSGSVNKGPSDESSTRKMRYTEEMPQCGSTHVETVRPADTETVVLNKGDGFGLTINLFTPHVVDVLVLVVSGHVAFTLRNATSSRITVTEKDALPLLSASLKSQRLECFFFTHLRSGEAPCLAGRTSISTAVQSLELWPGTVTSGGVLSATQARTHVPTPRSS